MLYAINSILCNENPTMEQFEDLVTKIESNDLFSGTPKRFIGQSEKIGRFTINRTKSLVFGNIVYDVYEHDHVSTEFDWKNKLIGYQIVVSDAAIKAVYRKNNFTFLDGGIELLINEKRYI